MIVRPDMPQLGERAYFNAMSAPGLKVRVQIAGRERQELLHLLRSLYGRERLV